MSFELIETSASHDGQVGEARLGKPPANILTGAAMRELGAWLRAETNEPRRKLLVVSGTGKNFSYGASVEEHLPGRVEEMLPAFHRLVGDLLECPVPMLAKVSGLCLGGGFELALACGFIFADETALFGVPEIQLGVFPPVAAALLPSAGAQSLATRLILSGEKVPARELVERGVIHRLAAAGNLDGEVNDFAEREILPKSASSLRIANRAAGLGRATRYRELIPKLESLYLGELMRTADAVEGIRSFVEKRKPIWRNA